MTEGQYASGGRGEQRRGLASRLLAITIAFVAAAELLLILPSLRTFRDALLDERGRAALVVVESVKDARRDAERENRLLAVAGLASVSIERAGRFDWIGLPRIGASVSGGGLSDILLGPAGGFVALRAEHPTEGVRAYVSRAVLRDDLWRHVRRELGATLALVIVVGALLYYSLLLLVVRRMRSLTDAIEAFRRRPFDASRKLAASSYDDEIGWAKSAFVDMQDEIRAALRQRERLAALGAAVAKIAHDLRNMLSTAQLATGRLAESDDPRVRQSAPRLERAIARAVALAEAASRYGRGDEDQPQPRAVLVLRTAEEAADAAFSAHPLITFGAEMPETLAVTADPEHLFRILENLFRNAAEAMSGREGAIRCLAGAVGEQVAIDVVDDGPGVPERARDRLFEAFATGSPYGLGLGLAASREMARANGGDLVLLRSTPQGATFRLTLRGAEL